MTEMYVTIINIRINPFAYPFRPNDQGEVVGVTGSRYYPHPLGSKCLNKACVLALTVHGVRILISVRRWYKSAPFDDRYQASL